MNPIDSKREQLKKLQHDKKMKRIEFDNKIEALKATKDALMRSFDKKITLLKMEIERIESK